MLNMPLFYHTPKIALVDDDFLFLRSTTSLLDKENILPFISSLECSKFFSSIRLLSTSRKIANGITELEDYDLCDQMPLNINIANLIEKHTESIQSEIPSIIIADYTMPELNGIELLRSISNKNIKKVLLTGSDDKQIAINSFNEGIIDRFISKGSPTLVEELMSCIKTLTKKYFSDKTRAVAEFLESEALHPISDPIFISTFEHLCDIHKINQYCMIDKTGCFWMQNEMGKEFYFVLHSDKTLGALENIFSKEKAFAFFLKLIVAREKIPFFGYKKESWQLRPAEWQNCFYPATVIHGREKYYYAIIEK